MLLSCSGLRRFSIFFTFLNFANTIFLSMFSFHDAGTYDAKTRSGGPNGSIRSDREYTHGGNAGMKIAIDLLGNYIFLHLFLYSTKFNH